MDHKLADEILEVIQNTFSRSQVPPHCDCWAPHGTGTLGCTGAMANTISTYFTYTHTPTACRYETVPVWMWHGRGMHSADCPLVIYHHHNRFMALFPGPPGWAGARRELLDSTVQGKVNRGRHTDHPAGRHSIRTNQCAPPPYPPYFLQAGCPSCRPTNSVKALKAVIYIYYIYIYIQLYSS